METNLSNFQDRLQMGDGDKSHPKEVRRDSFCTSCINQPGQSEMGKGPEDNYTSLTSSNTIGDTYTVRSTIHDIYETMQEITVEPRTDQPDVKAFFKVLRNHRLQSKLTYVLTVAGIVLTSHCVLSERWILPYLYSVLTPSLLFFRLIMYWKLKYQYFMLDFCYFANIYFLVYIWIFPTKEEMFAVGFSLTFGPLIWALFIFRNSLVFHSLDKVTSLYIHLMPSLLNYVIRWYPEETSSRWHKPFPKCEIKFDFVWLVFAPIAFHTLHQMIYSILVNLILKPSEDYLILFRYVTRNEKSLTFRLCNLCGPRYRKILYSSWSLLMVFGMLLLVPVWYNYFIPNTVCLIFFIVIAVFNGATYYVDVFSLERGDKTGNPVSEKSTSTHKQLSIGDNSVNPSKTVVTCSPNGEELQTKAIS